MLNKLLTRHNKSRETNNLNIHGPNTGLLQLIGSLNYKQHLVSSWHRKMTSHGWIWVSETTNCSLSLNSLDSLRQTCSLARFDTNCLLFRVLLLVDGCHPDLVPLMLHLVFSLQHLQPLTHAWLPVGSRTRWRLPEIVIHQFWNVVLVVIDDLHAHLDVPVHQTDHSEVIVVFSKRVVQSCRHVKPAHVEEELEDEEDWDKMIQWRCFSGQRGTFFSCRHRHLYTLTSDKGNSKVEVHCKMDHLDSIMSSF